MAYRLRAALFLAGTLAASGQGVNFYSKEKEAALGQTMAREIEQHTTALDLESARNLVNRVTLPLAAASIFT